MWEQELTDDEDSEFLLNGIRYGFKILTPQDDIKHVRCKNYKSATEEYHSETEQQIIKELELGRYKICDTPPTIVSSIGAIPKSSGSVRIIHDCSRPLGHSVNSYASKQSFKYTTVDKAVDHLPANGWMAKVDLSSAYRSVPIHSSNIEYMGLHWQFHGDTAPTYFVDTRLPFGGTECPEKFQRLTNAVCRMMHRRGYTTIAYLDDFLIMASNKEECQAGYEELLSLLQSLGFSINWNKAVSPAQSITFLGIEINSIARTLSLPLEKLQEIKSMLNAWLDKAKATKHQLQQLIGKLSWAARMVKSSRPHLRRLLAAMTSLKAKHHHIRLSADTKLDIAWWVKFIAPFNGTVHISSVPEPSTYLTTDACNTGGAACYQNDWYYAHWETDYPEMQSAHINVKELLAVLLAVKRWAHLWKKQHVILYTDSKCVMYMINNGTSRNLVAANMIRELSMLCVAYDCHITAKNLAGAQNVISDYLSRLVHQSDWTNFLASTHLRRSNLLNHMSHECIIYLQETAMSGKNWKKNASNIRDQHLLTAPNLHIRQW